MLWVFLFCFLPAALRGEFRQGSAESPEYFFLSLGYDLEVRFGGGPGLVGWLVGLSRLVLVLLSTH